MNIFESALELIAYSLHDTKPRSCQARMAFRGLLSRPSLLVQDERAPQESFVPPFNSQDYIALLHRFFHPSP